jgi:hypothetical protein
LPSRRSNRQEIVSDRGPEREVVKVRFADEDGPGLAKMRDGGRVALRHVPFAHARRGRSRHATDVEQVFDRDRDAVQRAAIGAGGELLIGFARLPQRVVGHHRDERVQPRVVRLDAAQAFFGDTGRSELARAQAAAELFDGHHVLGLMPGPKGPGLRCDSPASVVIRTRLRCDTDPATL